MSESIFEPVYPFQTGTENPLEQYDVALAVPEGGSVFSEKSQFGDESQFHDSEVPAIPQTDFETAADEELSSVSSEISASEPPEKSQFGSESQSGDSEVPYIPHTHSEQAADELQGDSPSGNSPSDSPEKSQFGDESQSGNPATGRQQRIAVVSIDERPTVQTERDKARSDLLDLVESFRSGRILTGTIHGVETAEGKPIAVLYHGDWKVMIPAEQAVIPPTDEQGRSPRDSMQFLLTKRLGAEVDYLVKGIDQKNGIAVASRLEAMRAKRREYYFGRDRNGSDYLFEGACAEARIVSVIRAGIFVDLFGVETYIPLRELSYQRMMDASSVYQSGQRILVKILTLEKNRRTGSVNVTASVKQAAENPYEKALRRYSVGNCYVGTVSMVDTTGIFVALDGGIDCLCSHGKRGRPPRGSRVTVRILGINNDTNRIWGAITHVAAAR